MSSALVPTVGHSSQIQKVIITADRDCKIMTDTEFQTMSIPINIGLPDIDVNSLNSVEELLTNTGNVSTTGSPSIPLQFYFILQPIEDTYEKSWYQSV